MKFSYVLVGIALAVGLAAVLCTEPMFEELELYLHRVNSGKPGDVIGKVVARDPDGDEVTYYLDDSEEASYFEIGNTTGVIKVAKQLPEFGVYEFNITAEDASGETKHHTLNFWALE